MRRGSTRKRRQQIRRSGSWCSCCLHSYELISVLWIVISAAYLFSRPPHTLCNVVRSVVVVVGRTFRSPAPSGYRSCSWRITYDSSDTASKRLVSSAGAGERCVLSSSTRTRFFGARERRCPPVPAGGTEHRILLLSSSSRQRVLRLSGDCRAPPCCSAICK